MKKLRSDNRSSKSKSTTAPRSVDEYLASIPEPARGTLGKIRAAIRSAALPEAVETISYRMPAIRYKGVLYAAFSNHCSLFPTASVVEAFKHELGDFQVSKGTIQFPTGKPLPTGLVERLVKAQVAQIEGKKRR